MNTPAFPRHRKQMFALAAGAVSVLALCTAIFTDSHSLLDPMAIATKGCKVISKSMIAGDIEAILTGTAFPLDNPEDGYCFNPPANVPSK